jgi:hypothetical protein
MLTWSVQNARISRVIPSIKEAPKSEVNATALRIMGSMGASNVVSSFLKGCVSQVSLSLSESRKRSSGSFEWISSHSPSVDHAVENESNESAQAVIQFQPSWKPSEPIYLLSRTW